MDPGTTSKRDPYHILVGKTARHSRQWGLLGRAPLNENKVVAVDLDNINTMLVMGVQGSGKSYTLQLLAESATQAAANLNSLPSPLCTIIFHYSAEQTYASEYISMREGNSRPDQVEKLKSIWHGVPAGIEDVLLLVPPRVLERRRQEFPGMEIAPIHFGLGELAFQDWQTLMGATGDESLYLQVMNLILEKHFEGGLTLGTIEAEIDNSALSPADKDVARIRLAFMARFLSEGASLAKLVKPGRLILVDLRDPTITERSAFRLIMVMLRLFAHAKHANGKEINKMMVFYECHRYMQDDHLVRQLVEGVALMRHLANTFVFDTQNPLQLKQQIIELASLIICNRMTSPRWLDHIRSVNDAWKNISIADLFRLEQGQGVLWAREASESKLTEKPFRVDFRVSYTQPGGATKTAIAAKDSL